MTSNRSSALLKIMKIEDQVNRVNKNPKYRKIQENLRTLKASYGSSLIKVSRPEDMNKQVTIRRNSDQAKEYLETYENMLLEYSVLMSELSKEKKRLRSKLF